MKKYLLMVSGVALVLNASALMAGSITDNYTKGDVLSAAKLDSIKTAVNDNNNASRFYGDGSAGPLTISSNTDWSVTATSPDNLNFTNVVIDAGVTLKVPAGTTIRCNGTFTNNGVIEVLGANNGQTFTNDAGKGDSRAAAEAGQIARAGFSGSYLEGGGRGVGIPKTVAASSFSHFIIGGGAGGGHVTNGVFSPSGGGLIRIYARGAIITTANIQANGAGGAAVGGGAGGIIILASSTSIDNTGAINAKGGNSVLVGSVSGASGGGGGGIIILVAPVIKTSSSTLFVNGGNAAPSDGSVDTSGVYLAGSGGGACGGNGGGGASIRVSSSGSMTSAGNGDNGYVLQIHANPAGMMQ